MNDGNDLPEFRLKGRIKIGASIERTEAVTICELGEDSDIAAVSKLETCNESSLPLKSGGRSAVVDYARVAMVYAL